MPRGNEAEQAAAEFQTRYGVHANAEELLQAHGQAFSNDLISASMQSLDQEATAELDLDAAKGVPKGATVVDGAVRGDSVIYLCDDGSGHLFKIVQDYEPGSKSGGGKKSGGGSKKRARRRKPKSDQAEGGTKAHAEALEAEKPDGETKKS